jgi:hypothetical protein
MKNNDNYITDYECGKMRFCNTCFWVNGELCIRQLLTEEEIAGILKENEHKKEKR